MIRNNLIKNSGKKNPDLVLKHIARAKSGNNNLIIKLISEKKESKKLMKVSILDIPEWKI